MKWVKGECSDGSGYWFQLDFGFGELVVEPDSTAKEWSSWFQLGDSDKKLGVYKTKAAAQRRAIRELKTVVRRVSKLTKMIEAIK